jgi:tRNA 2-thiocytidine biosynthesis protein TtcA
MKQMLNGWDKQFPGRLETIFASLQNIAPSQMADTGLFDFVNLTRNPDSGLAHQPAEDFGLDILER